MPWKGEKDPYLVWLSEIILQQTRVEQGLRYFIKFKEYYPTVSDLAQASEDELMKQWEGLGYYSRARNLHFSAQYIHRELNGVFPSTYDDILKLKGVGTYTAAAIASFAYQLPYAVVDGNVYRVLSRYFGIQTPTDSSEGKKLIAALAQELLDEKQAHVYNQALMDFGATVCKPKGATCSTCCLKVQCIAYQKEMVQELPVKVKKVKKQKRFFYYLVVSLGGKLYIRKRTGNDIWKNLYEFPFIETGKVMKINELGRGVDFFSIFSDSFYGILSVSDSYKQELTHRTIQAQFIVIEVKEDFKPKDENWVLVSKEELRNYPFPKIIDSYLKEKLKLF